MQWSNGFTPSSATISAFGAELGAVGDNADLATGASVEQLAATNDDYPLTAIKAAAQPRLYLPIIQANQP